jgi:hypothetical protein
MLEIKNLVVFFENAIAINNDVYHLRNHIRCEEEGGDERR